MSNTIKLKRGSGSDPGTSDLVVGEVAVRTDNGKLFTKKDDGTIAEISGSGGGGIDDGDKGDITVSNSGATFTIDNQAVGAVKIADGAVQTVKLADGAVTNAKIDTMAASKLTGALPAIDGSNLTGNGLFDNFVCHLKTNVDAALAQGSGNAFTVNFNLEEHNDSSKFSHSSGVITVSAAGWYRIYANMVYDNASASARNTIRAYVQKNGTEVVSTRTYDYDRGASYGKFSNNKVETMLYLAANDTVSIGNYAYNEDGNVTIESAECEFIVNSVTVTTSGTNADTLDGEHGSYYSNASNINAGTLPAARLPNHSAALLTSGTIPDARISGNFLKSNASDTMTGVLTLTTSSLFPLTINSSDNGKISLGGSVNPYIRFKENTTDKAFIQWNSVGFLTLKNEEDNSVLKVIDGIDVTGNISVSGTVDGVDLAAFYTAVSGLSTGSGVLASGVTTGTLAQSNNNTFVASTAFVHQAIANLVDSAPSALNTLNELAAALGDDANFSTTVTNSIGTKMPLAGGQFTGNVTFSGSQTVDGRDLSVDGAKLDGIESGATADQTAAEIRTLVESASDSNVFTDADHSKLNGIEASATADQTASEILTLIKTVDGAGSGLDADTLDGVQGSNFLRSNTSDTMNGDLTLSGFSPDLNFVSTSNNPDWKITNFQGSLILYDITNSANKFLFRTDEFQSEVVIDARAGVDVTGNISCTGTVDGRDLATDGSKLDGIESGATADQTKSDIDALGIAASTATTLATARTIAGVSFDGSANISLNNNAITNGAGYLTSVGTSNIADDAVTSAKIADDAITNAKLANDSVGSAQIANSAINNANFITGAIISNNNLVTGTITNTKISATAAIDGSKISPDFGSQNIVTTGSVTAPRISGSNGILEVKQEIGTSQTLTSGYNAIAVDPTIANGVTITVPSGATWSIV